MSEKLSIYPSPSAPITLIETPSPLAPHIRVARETTSELLGDGRKVAEGIVDTWVRIERRVVDEIRSVLPRDEPLTPGILYVGVAGLAGSVMARNRNILVRLLLPPALFLTASPYFLPKTSHNVRNYLARIEDNHFPAFAAQHDEINRTIFRTWSQTISSVEGLEGQAKGLGSRVVKGVEDSTGLRIGDAVASTRQTQSAVLRETESARGAQRSALQTAGQTGEVVGVVMEETPVAVIVAPKVAVEEKTLSGSAGVAVPVKRLV